MVNLHRDDATCIIKPVPTKIAKAFTRLRLLFKTLCLFLECIVANIFLFDDAGYRNTYVWWLP